MENEASSKDDQAVHFSGYVVALIDVLNQKEAIRALKAIPQNDDERADFVRRLKASIGTRNSVRDNIRRYLDSYQAATPDQPFAHLVNFRVQQAWARAKRHRIGTYLFSDTILIYSPLVNEWGEPGVHGIYSVLAACGSTMMTCMAGKVPIRGAVEIGWGIEWDHGELYGPGFLSAYELEQNAGWPRIVVGPELSKVLAEHQGTPPSTPREQLQSALAGFCQRLVWTDFDGTLAVDYVGQAFREMLGTEFNDLFTKGFEFTVAEHERFSACENLKLRDRYANVRQYYESRKHVWG